jgi:hypothetical protein
MNQLPSSANQSISSFTQFPLLGYPEFSQGLQSHIRVLRLLAYGFLILGLLLITSALGYQCWQQLH